MGSGFKDWAAGDVLTASDVDGYLMRQTVMTFADASARDTALSGVLDEGMVAYLEDTDAITIYDGSAWKPQGIYGDYTPTFTDVSFSSYTARYAIVGKLLHVWFSGILDAAVTGAIQISAPVATVPSNSQAIFGGSCYGIDDNTGGTYFGGTLTRSDDTFRFYSSTVQGQSASANQWDATAPFTWASGDLLSFSVVVEAS